VAKKPVHRIKTIVRRLGLPGNADASTMNLRDFLVRDYAKLKSRLMRRFGSADVATEILHDTYIRLSGTGSIAAIDNPAAYLYRVALNVAVDTRDAEQRWVDKTTIEMLRRRGDHELDPEQVTEARQEWQALLAALGELPARRQAIFLAARFEELSNREIAKRLGISTDTVDRELRAAFEFFAKRLGRNRPSSRGLGELDPS
jgi:RNA polymerase sigma factor (sigma-70 family)